MASAPFFYVRYAHKAEKLDLDLSQARDRVQIAYGASAVHILSKGTGAFTLVFHFYDGTELSLSSDELHDGDMFHWDVERLFLTNTAQMGARLKLLVEYQKGL
jgi:hypothetical protein